MSLAAIAAVVVTIFAQLAPAQTPATTTFDLSADFSFRDNPNKVWQYGYSETNSLAPDQFRVDQQSDRTDMKCDPTGSIGFWHPAANSGPGPGYYPYVAYNTTKQPQVGCKGWAVRPGEVAMEASNSRSIQPGAVYGAGCWNLQGKRQV